jgi:tetratricopeptide (TPR) repeat protein
LQKSVRKAYLQATLVVCEACLKELGVAPNLWRRDLRVVVHPNDEVRWLDSVRRAIREELRQLPHADYVPPSTEAEKQVELLLQPKGTTAAQRTHELCTTLKQSVLDELRQRHGEPPVRFTEMVQQGWDDPEPDGIVTHLDWFDLLSAFFVYELKQNQKVANIFQSELLVNLSVEGQTLTLELLKKQFEQFGKEMVTRLERLDERLSQLSSEQAEGFTAVQERLGEMLPTLALLPDIATQQQTLNELLQAALRELRRRPIYQRYVGIGVALKTEKLLDDYTALFVGREGKLAELDELLTAQRGVAAVAAPAGYGKTALLANWARLRHGDGCFTACHFFTERVTRSVTEAYRNLLRQLYAYYELTDEELPRDKQDLRDTIIGLLNERGARTDEPLVIVLDGLDEADEAVDLFFYSVPDAVFIVVSARWAGDNPPGPPSTEGNPHGEPPERLRRWLELKDSRLIRLDLMNESEIAEWLRQWGDGELRSFADDPSFVRDLHETTDGLPLYLRYLLDDLGQAARQGRDVRAVLEQTPKGFEAYVREQLRQLASHVRNEPAVRKLFALLTAAKGALRESEVEALTDDCFVVPPRNLRLSAWDLLDLSDAVTRWWNIGEESGERTYAFAHPLLAAEFADALGREAEQAKRELLDWCAQVAPSLPSLEGPGVGRGLRVGTVGAKPVSPYPLRHYAEHLLDAYLATSQPRHLTTLYELARNETFAQVQREKLPGEPDLPLKTLQLALNGAIKVEQPEAMAEMLLRHARKVATAESPLLAWRQSKERAIQLADFVFERDHQIGTLWLLLLAWRAVRDGEQEWAQRCLIQLRQRWEGKTLPELYGWRGELAEILLGELGQVSGVGETAGIVLGDNGKAEVAIVWAKHGNLDPAIELAQRISKASERSMALTGIAKSLAEQGKNDEALEVATRIENAVLRSIALVYVARALAEQGKNDEALEVATRIEEGTGSRSWALVDIAKTLAEQGKNDEALEVARRVEDAKWRSRALADIAKSLAEQGKTDEAEAMMNEALEIARTIEDAKKQSDALADIAKSLAEQGKTDGAEAVMNEALEVARTIEGAWSRSDAFVDISKAFAEQGKTEETEAVMNEALEAARVYTKERSLALTGISKAFAEQGKTDEAEVVINEALEVARRIEDAEQRSEALADMAKAFAEQGKTDEAEVVMNEALEVARRIEDAEQQSEVLSDIAKTFAEQGKSDEALEIATMIEYTGARSFALVSIAKSLTEQGKTDEALEVAISIEDARGRPMALASIAKTFAEQGKTDKAEAVMNEALKVAIRIEDAEQRSSALASIAKSLTEQGKTDKAEAVMNEALEVARRIEYTGLRSFALVGIAKSLTEQGKTNEALEVAIRIEDAQQRSSALANIPKSLAEQGKSDEALEVAIRIEYTGLRSSALAGIPKSLAEQGKTDEALEVARKIENAWERSRALAGIAKTFAELGDIAWAEKVAAEIERPDDSFEVWLAIGKGWAKAGQHDKAKDSFQKAQIFAMQTSEPHRYLWSLAQAQAEAGLHNEAVALAETLLAERTEHLPKVLTALAEREDEQSKQAFFRLLPLCGWDLGLAYHACGLLARLYPEQAGKVAEVVKGERS